MSGRVKKINEDEVISKSIDLAKELIEGNFQTIQQGRKESGEKEEAKFSIAFTLKPFEMGHELTAKFSLGITYKDEVTCEIEDPDQAKLNLN